MPITPAARSARGRDLAHSTFSDHDKTVVDEVEGDVNHEVRVNGSARDFLPARLTLPTTPRCIANLSRLRVYCNATQAVFGEGARNALVMFVGEQPGDQEDLAGKPFVGPAVKIAGRGARSGRHRSEKRTFTLPTR